MGMGSHCSGLVTLTVPPSPEITPVHLVEEVGFTPGVVWMGEKRNPPTPHHFKPQSIQTVVSCYTDNTILAPPD